MDAVVIGSGPNGLAAAVVLAQAGLRVVVHETAPAIGGATHSEELTLPGFVHDVGSAVHPMALASPFFRSLPLSKFGLEWIEPPAMVAHPFDDGTAAVAYRSLERTARLLDDERGYRRLMAPIVDDWSEIDEELLGPLAVPRHPLALAAFGLKALCSADTLARRALKGGKSRALFCGIAAHGMLPLEQRPSAAFGLVLGAMAHVVGWAIPRGGAQRIADALAGYLRSLGGEIHTSSPVRNIDDVRDARVIMCDLSPKPFLRIAGHVLPAGYREKLQRYRYGMGVFKVDWALDGPIPWQAEECALASTVHVGGTLDEIALSERLAWGGEVASRPFVLVAQPTQFDDSRAPRGSHVGWAYCHVPSGSQADMLPAIEAQIERFAPGFTRRVLARHVMTPADLESRNANLVGGDIGAGVTDLSQLFTRPTRSTYSTPLKGVYLCSASTPPGVGVHGMCGYHAARRALGELGIGNWELGIRN
jgi:phytoene dehydrogenase-like protein